MDLAGVKAPYKSNFGSKFENFVPPLISKGDWGIFGIFWGTITFFGVEELGWGFLHKIE